MNGRIYKLNFKQLCRERVRQAVLSAMAERQMSRNWWRPFRLWKAFQLWRLSRKGLRIASELIKARQAAGMRCALPKKKQRQLGMLPRV